jgi:hypothetical protein
LKYISLLNTFLYFSLKFENQRKQLFWKQNEKCNNLVVVRQSFFKNKDQLEREKFFILAEHLVLPTFIPKPLETWHALEKRSRQELMNEIRAQ